jgi:4-amino-4-deoxy-L-arabinose transferase-like glycosyltransferase
VVTVIGLAVRLVYVLAFRRDDPLWGDATFYHDGANLLVHGKGFIAPLQYAFYGTHVQAADHPPAYLLFLSLPSLVRLDTPLAHLVWSALLGTATIPVAGVLGRVVATPRAGVLTAAFVALSPNVWVYDGALLSETLAIFVTTVTALLAYRALSEPSPARCYTLAAACGVCALTRSELVLLVPALLVPVALRGNDALRARLLRAATAVLVAVAVMLPWVAYNVHRFEHPVFLSSQLEATLAGANCHDTYYGSALGLTTTTCIGDFDINADQSVTAKLLRHRAFTFIGDHERRVPVVVAARVARVAGLYRPSQQVDVDATIEKRERPLAVAGLFVWYASAALAIAGAIALRRNGRPLLPLLVFPAVVVVSVAATYGTDRFRATAEVPVLVLAAIAIDTAWRRREAAPG